jgi:hypothetical protein
MWRDAALAVVAVSCVLFGLLDCFWATKKCHDFYQKWSIEDVFHHHPSHADYNGRQLLFEGVLVTAVGLALLWMRFG